MNERNELIKEKLKKSLLNYLRTNSIHKISIKMICEDAQINRTTFYRYYKDEFDLLKDLENDASMMLRDRIVKTNKTVSVEQLAEYLSFIKSKIEIFEPFFFNESCEGFRKTFIELTFDVTQTVLPWKDGVPPFLGTFIGYGSLNVILEWIESDFEVNVDEIAKTIYRYNEAVVGSEFKY